MIKCENRLAILMSCYNGNDYIEAQIASIINQTYRDWILYIRDDGSSDNTLDIIKRYCEKDRRIRLYTDNLGNLRTRDSFLTLLENIDADFYSFADQDDIWLSNKLMEAITTLSGVEEPALFTSNVTIVNQKGDIITQDYWKHVGLDPKVRFRFKELVVNPSIIGMTMVFNKVCRNYIFPYNGLNLLHDSWISINIAQHGKVIYSNKPSVLYRQHDQNVCGLQFVKYKKQSLYGKLKQIYDNNRRKYATAHKVFGIGFVEYIYIKSNIVINTYLQKIKFNNNGNSVTD